MCDCFDGARDVSGEAVHARDVTPAAELQPSVVSALAAALVTGFPTEEYLEDRILVFRFQSDGKLDCQQPLEDCVLQPR